MIHDQIRAAAAVVKVAATHNILAVTNDARSEFDERVSSAKKWIVSLSSPPFKSKPEEAVGRAVFR